MKPFFSIVIPTYNCADKIKRTLDSVIAQTCSDYEVLVMDDGSTDDTAAVVAAFNDPRIIYEWDKNFGGPARPRNRGIVKAQGDWICFLDADDWWTVDKLEICLEYINDQVDLIYHDLEIVSDCPGYFRRKLMKSRQVKRPVLIDLLLNGNSIANSSVVVRRNLLKQIGGIDENIEMIACEDYNTWLRISQITDKFLYVHKCLGYYFLHSQGISRKDMSLPAKTAVANFIGLLSQTHRDSVYSFIAYLSGRFHYLNGDYSKASSELKYCLKNVNFLIRIRAIYMLMYINLYRVARFIVLR